jgi:hypothetical protein
MAYTLKVNYAFSPDTVQETTFVILRIMGEIISEFHQTQKSGDGIRCPMAV